MSFSAIHCNDSVHKKIQPPNSPLTIPSVPSTPAPPTVAADKINRGVITSCSSKDCVNDVGTVDPIFTETAALFFRDSPCFTYNEQGKAGPLMPHV